MWRRWPMSSSLLNTLRADYRAHHGRQGLFGPFITLVRSPGFLTIAIHRLASRLEGGGPISRQAGRMLWRYNCGRSGCYISLSCNLGEGIELPHPIGIVIGDGVIVGSGATIYQNVTLGTRAKGTSSYPTLGDNVVVYPGAVVVGPIRVDDGAVIAANAFVAIDVGVRGIAAGVPAKLVGDTLKGSSDV